MIRVVPRSRQKGITLVELLVVMSIMLVLSTMIIGTWVALTNAYSFTSRSDKQRDLARQAIDRMAREIRDAQEPLGSTSTAINRAYPNEIRFYSTFNAADASTPTTEPRLTRFIYKVTNVANGTGAVYREFPGADGDFDTAGDNVSERLIANVSNDGAGEDVFTYWSYDPATADLEPSVGMTTLADPSRVVEVGISLLVDLNPGKAPNYMDISTKVQPRNVREF
jgi:prepilin-type N-terminal cleavage/methylation domain-containing protein